MTDIYLHLICAHHGLSGNAPASAILCNFDLICHIGWAGINRAQAQFEAIAHIADDIAGDDNTDHAASK